MSKWKIYYDDGSTRSWRKGIPSNEKERLGILCIIQERSDGRSNLLHGVDYYIFDGGHWVPVGLNGLEDWVMNLLGQVKCVIKGRAVESGLFKETYERAKKDRDKEALD